MKIIFGDTAYFLQDQVCSLELAKKIKELGVKQKSFWAWYETTDRDDIPRLNRFDESCPACQLPKQPWEEKYSAFTVAELGELLKDGLHGNWKSDDGIWTCTFTASQEKTLERTFGETEADARAKMLIYLLENSLIKLS